MNILLVSDNLLTRSQLEGSWRRAGAEVTAAPGPQAPDLVCVDLNLADAQQRIRDLRERCPETRILAFGPHVDAEAFTRAAGADGGVARGRVVERVLRMIGERTG